MSSANQQEAFFLFFVFLQFQAGVGSCRSGKREFVRKAGDRADRRFENMSPTMKRQKNSHLG